VEHKLATPDIWYFSFMLQPKDRAFLLFAFRSPSPSKINTNNRPGKEQTEYATSGKAPKTRFLSLKNNFETIWRILNLSIDITFS